MRGDRVCSSDGLPHARPRYGLRVTAPVEGGPPALSRTCGGPGAVPDRRGGSPVLSRAARSRLLVEHDESLADIEAVQVQELAVACLPRARLEIRPQLRERRHDPSWRHP